MKQKQIHDFVKQIVSLLSDKVRAEEKQKVPEATLEYSKGQLYEASYILEHIESIIYKD